MNRNALIFAGLLLSHCTPAPTQDAGTDASVDALVDAPMDASRTPLCTSTPPVYPPGPYTVEIGATLPDLRFVRQDGTAFFLHDVFTPCAQTPPLVVLRSMAAWSGPARWNAEHTARWEAFAPGRLRIVDLLVLGQDNLPARMVDLAPWSSRYDRMPDTLVIDPEYVFRGLYLSLRQLPLVVTVDPRTMKALSVMYGLPVHDAKDAVGVALARLDGRPIPPPEVPVLHDGQFSDDQWDMLHAMSPVPPPPADPTNAVADNPAAVTLGGQWFRDAQFSPSGTVSCSSCHDPNRAFADGRPVGMGIAMGGRNTPSVRFVGHLRWLFWDGRADSVWSQALGPVENPVEMASSRLYVAHQIADRYATAYAALFGALPPLGDTTRFPASGMPGQPGWDAMTTTDQQAVNQVFSNMGKAIEAFERSIVPRAAPFDAYAAGDTTALSGTARTGLKLFFDNGCVQCHHGPLLSNQSFHNIVMPAAVGTTDMGRFDAIARLMSSPFTVDGIFSDAPRTPSLLVGVTAVDSMRGQFRTPSLRGVAETGPWGHGGTFTTLEDVVVHYARRGQNLPVMGTSGQEDTHLGNFHEDPQTVLSITAFLRSLTPTP